MSPSKQSYLKKTLSYALDFLQYMANLMPFANKK